MKSYFSKSCSTIFSIHGPSIIIITSFDSILGQAIRFEKSSGIYSDCSFNAILADTNSTLSVARCSFVSISEGANKGAIYITSSTASASIKDCQFISCTSNAGCAGVCASPTVLSISLCCFYDCSGYYVDGSGLGGGGIYVSSSATFNSTSNTFLASNQRVSDRHGAMIINSVDCTASYHNFSNNYGIATLSYGSALVLYSPTRFSCNYMLYQCNTYGSELVINGAPSGTVISTSIVANGTASNGAHVYHGSTSIYMNNCSFFYLDGCIVYEANGGQTVYFVNCFFSQSASTSLLYGASQAYSATNCQFGLNKYSTIHCFASTLGSCFMMISRITQTFTSDSKPQNAWIYIGLALCALAILS